MTDVDYKQVSERLYECRDGLERIFEASNDITEKHKCYKAIRAVNGEIEAILVARLKDSTNSYVPLTDGIKMVTNTLKDLQARIDDIIADVEAAAKVAATIAKVVQIVGKFAA